MADDDLFVVHNQASGATRSVERVAALRSLPADSVDTDAIEDEAVTADKTAFGGDFSTSEVDTGFTWVDGKTIYKKSINFGTLPNATTKSVAHSIGSIDNVVKMVAIAKDASSNFLPLPFGHPTDASNISFSLEGANLVINAGSNRTAFSAYATVWYTKP
jgi:hypothetical protein